MNFSAKQKHLRKQGDEDVILRTQRLPVALPALTYVHLPDHSRVVQSLSHVDTMDSQVSLSFTISWNFLKLVSSESVMPSNHYILCCPLLLPSVFPRVFSNESALVIRWPKYCSFHFSISAFNELIYFRTDWFDLLQVQGTIKSLLQNHSSKASILWCSAFFYGPVLTCIQDYWIIPSLSPYPCHPSALS